MMNNINYHKLSKNAKMIFDICSSKNISSFKITQPQGYPLIDSVTFQSVSQIIDSLDELQKNKNISSYVITKISDSNFIVEFN